MGRPRDHRKESKSKFGKLTAGLAVSPVAVEEVETGESGAPAGSAEDPEEPTEVQKGRGLRKALQHQRPKNSRNIKQALMRCTGLRVYIACGLEQLQLETKQFHTMRRVKYQ